ncbi:MAG TPA: DUF1345 domain-containing protein [Stellaceae bacterium]|nr:DUF1345 domain-containing protein [Stellaceae bacterium]
MPSILRHILAGHQRLLVAGIFGVAVPLVLPGGWNVFLRWFIGWDAGVTLHLALVWLMMLRSAEADIRRRAQIEDESRIVILGLCVAAALVSLAVLPGLLGQSGHASSTEKAVRLCLGVYTIVASWFFLHTIFVLHYAHEYYGAVRAESAKKGGAGGDKSVPKQRGGLDFAGDEPFYNYIDFAYFAFTIGMTAQTSDTQVTTSPMRRLALAHSIVTFFFNTGILALSINLVAGLLTGGS